MVYKRALFQIAVCCFIAAPLFAITRSWSGAASANWSNPANWSPAGTPAAVDSLIFPAAALNRAMINDLPAGTNVGAMTFNDNYTLSGNVLTLSGDLSFLRDANGVAIVEIVFNTDLKLATAVTFGSAKNNYNGAIDVNGQTLTVDESHTSNETASLNGPLNGGGTVTITGQGAYINGTGTFNGTITGPMSVSGSLPNATVNGRLSGAGTVGNATVTAPFSPGNESPWKTFGFDNQPGVLHTKSLVLNAGARFDLVPAGGSDQVQTAGTVAIGGSLTIDILSGGPAAGQTFVIIDNDGTDAVTGTFTGLPEGATVAGGIANFAISYHGGDGNDVVLTALSTQKTWTSFANTVWSNPQNWNPQAVPSAGEPLLFPAGVFPILTNDLPAGTLVGAMTFNGNYTLSGNPLTLNGDLSFLKVNGSPAVYVTINSDLKLATAVTFGSAPNSYNGAIDVNGQTLTVDESSTVNDTASLNGPLNGSGTILITGQGAYIKGTGTFSGTITGSMNVSGSIPNATVNGSISGVGTVGNATATTPFSPGNESPWKTFGFDIAAGVLHTKSLVLNAGARFDLVPGGTSDQVQAAGTITIGGSLIVDILSGAAATGQTFTIIDNDGADPVSGAFAGLPEGATLAAGTTTFGISYHGGDGNDVVLTALSGQKAWTGAVSSLWSDSRNWSPQAVPLSGEPVLFPAGAVRLTVTNDLPAGTTVGAMIFNDNYTLSGNGLTLNGNLAFRKDANGYANVQVTFNADLKLAAAVTFGSAPNNYNGVIDVNGQTLRVDESSTLNDTASFNGPLNGTGTITITGQGAYIKGAGTFSGTITGPMNVSGSIPNATVNGRLSGVGTVGNATSSSPFSPGNESPWKTFGFDNASGVMHTKSLVLNSGARFDLAPGAISDQVQVTGTVTVGGALTLDILSGALAVGQSFTLIDNDGADPVSGTFTGMPERTTFSLGGQVTRISYQGGDGNDVVLSVLADTSSVLTQSAGDTKVGEPWTLTNTVSCAAGVPTGSVSFAADGVALGTAAVVNGVASLTIAPASVGTHHVIATFLGTGVFADSVSAVVSHVVSPGQTSTALTADPQSSVFGQAVHFTATVSAVAPAAGQPDGNVTFMADGSSIGTVAVMNGVATVAVANLSVGTHSIVSTFAGTANFLSSVSTTIAYVTAKGTTKIDLAADHPTSVFGQAVHFTATVSVIAPAAGQPGGNVTFLADGSAIGTVPVLNGTATFETTSLHAGSRSITATYNGDANFNASAATALQQSIAKAVTRVDASPHSVLIGASPSINVSVSVPARSDLVPSGSVTVSRAGVVLGASPLAHGAVSFTLAPLPAGDHSLLVAYSGDSDFEASSATVVQTVSLPTISCIGTHVLEGNHGVTTATVVVTLSAPVPVTVRVSFSTVAGSAKEGEDFEKASGVVEFAPGEVTRSIELHILGDTSLEPAEAFSVLLFDAFNATIETPSAAIVIVDDDHVPPRHRASRP
ncbi:MAG TPA: Ig-like domain repeat protein [Thermoanaerobaculia bacterium]|nr:Ig-like domain repeat protein [Thermoanaerobaculia bacterium]